MIKILILIILIILLILILLISKKFNKYLIEKKVFYKNVFLIGNKKLIKYNHIKKIKINKSIYIYYKELDIKIIYNKNNEKIIIIGDYFFSKDDMNNSIFKLINLNNILNIMSSIIGNFIIIYNNKIYHDVLTQIPIYYTFYKNTIFITNCCLTFKKNRIKLIKNYYSIKLHGTNTLDHDHKNRIFKENYPPPLTQYRNVYKLQPSEILTLKGLVIKQKLYIKNNFNFNKIIDIIIDRLKITINNIFKECLKKNKKMYLPITAGYDSRVILALAKNQNIPVICFTIIRDKIISKEDKTVPQKLAKLCNYKYLKIKKNFNKNNIIKKLVKQWDKIIGNNINGVDKEYYIRDTYNFIGKGDYIIGGDAFEIVDAINKRWLQNTIGYYFYKLYKQKIIDWDLLDSYYFESYLGTRLSLITSIFKIEKDLNRIMILNSNEILNLILSIPKSKRSKHILNRSLIRKLYPQLDKFNYN